MTLIQLCMLASNVLLLLWNFTLVRSNKRLARESLLALAQAKELAVEARRLARSVMTLDR